MIWPQLMLSGQTDIPGEERGADTHIRSSITALHLYLLVSLKPGW